jgi:hypothetical protein
MPVVVTSGGMGPPITPAVNDALVGDRPESSDDDVPSSIPV